MSRSEADPAAAALFARVFRGGDGTAALAHLRRLTIERRLPPDASDAALRHLEGQRFLVAHIETLVARGQTGPLAIMPDMEGEHA